MNCNLLFNPIVDLFDVWCWIWNMKNLLIRYFKIEQDCRLPRRPDFPFTQNNFQRAIVYINPNWRNKNIFLHKQTIILFFYKNIDKIFTYSKLTCFYKLSATILLLIVTGTTKSTSRVRVENGAIHLGFETPAYWSSSISAFHMKTKPTAIGEKARKINVAKNQLLWYSIISIRVVNDVLQFIFDNGIRGTHRTTWSMFHDILSKIFSLGVSFKSVRSCSFD